MTFAALALLFANTVSFEAVATGVAEETAIEFLFAGPESDRDYESMFLTEESPAKIVRKFEKAGFPAGSPVDNPSCRFWPAGAELEIEPSLDGFVKDSSGAPLPKAIYTGGSRDSAGGLVAETNMPSAVFALYSLAQSPVQFDGALDQSPTYGRFRAAKTLPKGEKVKFTVKWTGAKEKPFAAEFKPGNAADVLRAMRAASEEGELDVLVSFSGDMAVKEAADVAQTLAKLDSAKVKINGYRKGEFFYRAFLPLESWRDRKERLAQPYEVRLGGERPVLSTIEEDWSGADENTLEPRLAIRENVGFAEVAEADDRVDTCFVYAPADTRLAEVYAVRGLLPARIVNWYVYIDE